MAFMLGVGLGVVAISVLVAVVCIGKWVTDWLRRYVFAYDPWIDGVLRVMDGQRKWWQ